MFLDFRFQALGPPWRQPLKTLNVEKRRKKSLARRLVGSLSAEGAAKSSGQRHLVLRFLVPALLNPVWSYTLIEGHSLWNCIIYILDRQ